MAIRKHLLHAKSAVPGKLPTAENIEYGEIAVNYAEGTETLSIRNSNDDIVTFMNSNAVESGLAAKADADSVYTKEKTDTAIAAAVGDVEESGTSPLNLSSGMQDGKLVITGSIDNATASTAGIVKPVSVLSESVEINDASTAEGRYYPVQTNSDNQMVVNIPWIDYSEEKETLQRIYDYLKEQAVTYGDITATLTYPNISASGGTSSPTLTYSQTATHFDGTTEIVTSGAIVTYSGNYVNMSSGVVTYNDINTSTSQKTVDTVTATITLNGKSTTVTAIVYQTENSVTSYGSITATLTYSDIPASGGTAEPTLTYSQTVTNSNGTTETVTSGASVTYSSDIGYVDPSTGVVTYDTANTLKSQVTVDTVTVTVTLNGVTTTVTATVYQEEGIALMNVAFYDNTEDKIITVEGNNINTDDYPASRYTPIGIVVVPSSWNIYGDGTCGVMSLSEMNCSTPDTGSNTAYQYIYLGHCYEDAELTNYNGCVVTNGTSSPSEYATGVNDWADLPSDAFSAVACPTDSSAYYYDNMSSCAAPSPYLDDGSLNPVYVQTESPSSEFNCFSDFDGKGNTEVLLELSTKQSDWKTAGTITNYYENGYSPAACCCWRYSTEGTKQGDWYLPAMGELGCVMARFSAINNTISKLNSVYGTVGLSLYNNYGYWSSSVYSYEGARYVDTSGGYVGHKSDINYVRAFARL